MFWYNEKAFSKHQGHILELPSLHNSESNKPPFFTCLKYSGIATEDKPGHPSWVQLSVSAAILGHLASLPMSWAALSTHTSSMHLSLREFWGIHHIALGLRLSLNVELNVCYDELCRAWTFWVSLRLPSSCPGAYSALCVLHPSAPHRAQSPSFLSLRNDLPLASVCHWHCCVESPHLKDPHISAYVKWGPLSSSVPLFCFFSLSVMNLFVSSFIICTPHVLVCFLCHCDKHCDPKNLGEERVYFVLRVYQLKGARKEAWSRNGGGTLSTFLISMAFSTPFLT